MILGALNDYYTRLLDDPDTGISPPGYSREKISYAVVLDLNGNVVSVDDVQDTNGKKPVPRSMSVPQPEKRTVDIKSNFLWDKTSYALGVSANSKRSDQEHAAFKVFHQQVLAGTADPGLLALLEFLERWNPEQFNQSAHFTAHREQILDTNVVFQLDGELGYLHERLAARDLRTQVLDGTQARNTGVCLVTGELAPLARLHPAIKGVNGAQSSGASIVSFNLNAFNSYGKNQGENAPISEQAAFAYTTTLNHLLRRDPHNRQRLLIGDASVVFWAQADNAAQEEAAENLFAAFLDPKSEDARETEKLRNALELVRHAKPFRDLDPNLNEGTNLYVLGLAPNASRLSIRFWETGTLQAFTKRLFWHYEDLRLEPSPWRTPPALWQLLLASAPTRDGRAKSEDVPPTLAGEMTRAILTGGRYPYSLLGTLIMRMRADHDEKAFGTRAALIKAILTRAKRLNQNTYSEGGSLVSLDPHNTNPGYLLGRLFFALENIQRASLGPMVNATIRDRYYGAASATPAIVFPVLLRNAQNHLSHLRKNKPGYATILEKEVGEIINALDTAFPRNLGLEAQGHFAIGYYHQKRAHFTNSAPRENNGGTTDLAGEIE